MTSWNLQAPGLFAVVVMLCGCSEGPTLPSVGISASTASYEDSADYLIGPGDSLDITVWRDKDLSGKVPVRPDGRISIPIVGDIVAAGKTPTELAKEIQDKLKPYVQVPLVTVAPIEFVGPTARQVRVIGEAVQPRAVPYKSNMTLLDVMIEVGGLSRYADGDRAVIVRFGNGAQQSYHVHLDGLIRDGDIDQNVAMRPGDVLIIPQRFF